MDSVLFSHNSDNWKTPIFIYNYFVDHGYIDTFPYCSNINEFDNNYKDCKLFINPPFSKMNDVINWVLTQYKDNYIVMLLPVRSDTIWWHKLLSLKPFIYFLRGRLHYNDSNSAPFPSCFVILSRSKTGCNYLFGDFERFKDFII